MRRTALIKSNNPHLAGGEYISKRNTQEVQKYLQSRKLQAGPQLDLDILMGVAFFK
jgi:hypothetical protein